MTKIEAKIKRAIESNKLNPEILGERNWYNYFIKVSELIWLRNNYDGYLIEIYSDYTKIEHLATVKI
jgi:hypothetical protein